MEMSDQLLGYPQITLWLGTSYGSSLFHIPDVLGLTLGPLDGYVTETQQNTHAVAY